jgi:hypothetical protein
MKLREPTPPADRIFFLHIPKCGGTSVDNAIARLFPSSNRARLAAEASFRAARLLEQPLDTYREQLLLYMLSQSRNRFVIGHFSWSEIAYRTFHPEWKFITILRDPVARWFSTYFYNRYKNGDHTRIDSELPEFLESPAGIGAGRQFVQKFAAVELRRGPSDEEALAARQASARANLAKFDLVGFVEHLDAFSQRFYDLFARKLEIGVERESPRSRDLREREMTPEVVERVRKICRPDLEFYEDALQKYR